VLIDEDTQRALNDSVGTEPLGAVALKGKSSAVEVFALDTGPD
jgi:hypothetical protein